MLSERGRMLLSEGADLVLRLPPEWIGALHAAALGIERIRPVADDPVLAEAVRRMNLANLMHWAAANVRQPGRPVAANLEPVVVESARELVRRGLDEIAVEAFRASYGVIWRGWIHICFQLTSDPDELRELMDVAALSITTFIEDTLAALMARMSAERAELTRGAHAERRAMVTLLLEGAPVGRLRAEARLGYGLTGPHTAAVVWGDVGTPPENLERAAESVLHACRAPHRLTVLAGSAALWLWFPVAASPRPGEIAPELDGVRVALGRPGHDLEGFRRSHLDALAAQRMVTRLASPHPVARYEDIEMVALVTAETTQSAEFIAGALGDLAAAGPELRDTVLTYLRELGNATRTAELLYTHRNTVLRRLARAEELLPRPLRENALDVAVALAALRWTRS